MKNRNYKTVVFQIILSLIVTVQAFGQREIYIEGYDKLRFSVETIHAQPGEKITIRLKTITELDKSQMAHNWVLLKQNTDALNFVMKGLKHPDNEYIDPSLSEVVIAKTEMLGGGEEDTVTFTVPQEKGEYEYVCTFRAHYQAGMKGELIVE